MRNIKNPAGFVRKRVGDLSAYSVEPIPAEVILDANELGLALPEKLRKKIDIAIAGAPLGRYPDPEAGELRQAIAKKEGCRPGEILLGNGSDEVIQALIAALCDPDDKIFTVTPTFSMYRQIATYLNVETVEEELDDNWDVKSGDILMNIDKACPRIIFIASPNNPTGATFNRDALASIMNTAEGLVVIDEAYVDYAERNIGLLYEERSNVAIIRTLSKTGLAGIRLGYLLADERLIAQVNKVRLPYNINSLTQAIATEAFNNWDMFAALFEKVKAEREKMFTKLFVLKGVTPYPSEANFILMKIEGDTEAVFNSLIEDGVRVRWFKDARRLNDCFRVTIGTEKENDRFLKALSGAI
ncbi:Histidinol-phosphate aminotransferase [hydrothermal vent metagenome]|uniref:Histidinol-phosphate aminotransferase n=1 Tax=hydrothermal vent metagenome TaxID=652676 RepID=A0A3B1BER6_9ZZZZ